MECYKNNHILLSPLTNTAIPFYCWVIVYYLFCLFILLTDIRTFLFVITMNKSSMDISHDYILCVCVCVVSPCVHICAQVCMSLYTQIVKIESLTEPGAHCFPLSLAVSKRQWTFSIGLPCSARAAGMCGYIWLSMPCWDLSSYTHASAASTLIHQVSSRFPMWIFAGTHALFVCLR